MAETLVSVGLDVGTTSTQMVVSELKVENQASAFAVPSLSITDRKIRYRSPVYFTPLLSEDRIDGAGIRQLVEAEYEKAGITRQDIDTGAVIITGETSRKENAGAVLTHLSSLAGDFVVATAGPDLESRLAAKGAGAADRSADMENPVLHMDIGGGTSNLALLHRGKILDTGCINVGGRLLRFDGEDRVTYVSPVLEKLTEIRKGDRISRQAAAAVAQTLARVLEMAAGLRPGDETLQDLVTREGKLLEPELLSHKPVLSFSGGVADCIEHREDWRKFGDLGPLLGEAIRESRLCQEQYFLGRETIRATVIGAGAYSTQLSGSTVFCRNVELPLKNLPAVVLEPEGKPLELQMEQAQKCQEGPVVFALSPRGPMDYGAIRDLAEALSRGAKDRPCYLCLTWDMAKALGQALALRLGSEAEILCLDGVCLEEGSYLDVGRPVGPAIPVVVKTLVLGNQE